MDWGSKYYASPNIPLQDPIIIKINCENLEIPQIMLKNKLAVTEHTSIEVHNNFKSVN